MSRRTGTVDADVEAASREGRGEAAPLPGAIVADLEVDADLLGEPVAML